jgi:hypothetical protein
MNHQDTSALEDLQLSLISGKNVEKTELFAAINSEIQAQAPLNQTVLLKVLSAPRMKVSVEDYHQLTLVFREAMIKVPLTEPEVFINYAQCAALCMKKALKS